MAQTEAAQSRRTRIFADDRSARHGRRCDFSQIVCRAAQHVGQFAVVGIAAFIEHMNCTVKRQNNLLTVMARGVQQSVLTVHGGQCESFLFGKTLRIFADRQAFGHRLRIIAIRLALVCLKLFEMKTESKRNHEGFE